MLVRLLEADAPPATYHATNRGVTTWYGLARETLRLARLSTQLIPVRTEDVPRAAARPRFSVLDCTATETIVGALSSWQDALAAALAEEL